MKKLILEGIATLFWNGKSTEIHMAVDGKESVSEVEELSMQIQNTINSKFPSIERISVIPYSSSEIDNMNVVAKSKRNILQNIKLKKQQYIQTGIHQNRN